MMSVQPPQALFPQSTPTQKPPSSPQSDDKISEFLDSAQGLLITDHLFNLFYS